MHTCHWLRAEVPQADPPGKVFYSYAHVRKIDENCLSQIVSGYVGTHKTHHVNVSQSQALT